MNNQEPLPCPPGHRLVRPVWAMLGLQLLAVLLLTALVIQRPSRQTAPKTWKYKVEQITDTSFEDRLNVLGKQGWELVYAKDGENGYEAAFKK